MPTIFSKSIGCVTSDLVDEERTDLDLSCFDDDSIHVVSSNWLPSPAYEDYFRECRARCRRLVPMHTSDEWRSSGYAPYRHLDAVIRNFATGLARHEGIWTIPEGYANGTRADVVLRPITERKYEWSFTGQPLSRHADPTSNRLLRTLGTRTTLPRFAFARCHHNVTEQPWRDPPAPSARAVLPLVFKLKLPAGGDPIHLCK